MTSLQAKFQDSMTSAFWKKKNKKKKKKKKTKKKTNKQKTNKQQ